MEDKIKQIIEIVKSTAVAAGQSAGRAAEATGKKAEEFFEQTKQTLHIIDLENEISDLYREIGKLVYMSRSDDSIDPGEIEEKVLVIDQKREGIEVTRDKLDALKRTKKCPNPSCGKRCAKDDKFCHSCGAVLED